MTTANKTRSNPLRNRSVGFTFGSVVYLSIRNEQQSYI